MVWGSGKEVWKCFLFVFRAHVVRIFLVQDLNALIVLTKALLWLPFGSP